MPNRIKQAEKSGVEGLVETLCRIRTPEEMKKFLTEILTPAELHDLSLRWELMRMLSEGIPQRQIAAILKISLCKITRGSKILKNPDSVTNRYLK
ncbi:MAG TPA: Trp family transcriptional regulator [Anaerohalosphaeraceae bacterium]|nr:Trp family transcriptional regulator [Anaerohalosphaeraceae bacterium]HOQ04231.1 Trp family transcriptional regulator [Anaerohalosphaeraceae bacterium]HPP56242.1 Trp family transcriptional regulator [Anaerohalosphaeraceae bacterium]